MTFPLGTMSLANSEIATLHKGLHALRVVGAMYGAALIVIDVGCILGTFYCAIQDVRAEVKVEKQEDSELDLELSGTYVE